MKQERDEPYLALREVIQKYSDAEKFAGAEMFFNRPDRWYEEPHWRCINNHVKTSYLKSELKGDLCFSCGEHVALTFPEDKPGPLAPLSD